MGDLTEEEKNVLMPFVTSTERNIFVLTNLPEVIKGALFSRYSRSTKSLRRLLIDEFLKDPQSGLSALSDNSSQSEELRRAIKKAQDFYDRVLDGYGDDSVGELGGAHVAIENVSIIATKIIQDSRIGGSPLEKSTRYVWFGQKVDGDFLFYKEPKLMASKHKDLYLEINRKLFQTYADLVTPITEFVKTNFPLEDFAFFDSQSKKEIPFSNITDEKMKKRAQIAYNSAVRAKACDMLRGLLPASTLTNMGVYGNGRFFQFLLSRLYTNDLSEAQIIGKEMKEELDKVIPSFVRRAAKNEYKEKSDKRALKIARELTGPIKTLGVKPVALANYDKNSEDELVSSILYPHSKLSMMQLNVLVQSMTPDEKIKIIMDYIGDRKARRDKPGRAFEHIYYTFDILADFGLFRDLHRHRVLTQQRQLLSTDHGYDLSQEIVQAGFGDVFESVMKDAKEAYEIISKDYPNEAQYAVPLAYNIRFYMKLNLREAFHLIELRSTPQGHPGYRKIAQLMYKEIEKVHPVFAKAMKFVDLNDYPLGRLKSEMRKEEKRELKN
ncbi:MAG: thymidylate synthase [Nanoarchaeota archaeon]|nr:MAG: thymidylate synthase [Nanoarchaeota archaeon]